MSCIYTVDQHDQAFSVAPAVKKSTKVVSIKIPTEKMNNFNEMCKNQSPKVHLRKVALVTYHEIHQTSKVISQELRSSSDKCSF